ncbi:hypothetical protein FOCG_18535 [Fusarium oxysporum f. sp. radicis-lycopersici 26381]|nr:hypothetical protein FOCG_18535 [Fusarium oxysporum f. sp. radicis-lycopersici 26381]
MISTVTGTRMSRLLAKSSAVKPTFEKSATTPSLFGSVALIPRSSTLVSLCTVVATLLPTRAVTILAALLLDPARRENALTLMVSCLLARSRTSSRRVSSLLISRTP